MLTIIQVLLSTSVALILIFILCLFIPFVIRKVLPKYSYEWSLKKIIILLLPIFLFVSHQFLISGFSEAAINNFTDHFDSDTDIRFEQRKVLIDAWKEAPIFGHGYGFSIVTSARGRQSGFESMYHAILASTGLVGIIFVFSYYLIIIRKTLEKTRLNQDPFCFAILLCFISSIICSTTNPALGTFDGLLPIYACLACIANRSHARSRLRPMSHP